MSAPLMGVELKLDKQGANRVEGVNPRNPPPSTRNHQPVSLSQNDNLTST